MCLATVYHNDRIGGSTRSQLPPVYLQDTMAVEPDASLDRITQDKAGHVIDLSSAICSVLLPADLSISTPQVPPQSPPEIHRDAVVSSPTLSCLLIHYSGCRIGTVSVPANLACSFRLSLHMIHRISPAERMHTTENTTRITMPFI